MPILSKDEILKAEDLPREVVEVPEWGGSVMVRGLSASERDAFEGSIIELRGKERKLHLENIRAKLASLTMVDEQGERLFTDAEVAALGKKSAQAVQRVFEAAQRLSGISETDVEELAKNSGNGQRGGLHSD
jgi:hypothetical protein